MGRFTSSPLLIPHPHTFPTPHTHYWCSLRPALTMEESFSLEAFFAMGDLLLHPGLVAIALLLERE